MRSTKTCDCKPLVSSSQASSCPLHAPLSTYSTVSNPEVNVSKAYVPAEGAGKLKAASLEVVVTHDPSRRLLCPTVVPVLVIGSAPSVSPGQGMNGLLVTLRT